MKRTPTRPAWPTLILLLAACPDKDEGSGTVTDATSETTSTAATSTAATSTDATSEPTGDATGSAGTTTAGGAELVDCQTVFTMRDELNKVSCPCEVQAGNYPDVRTCLADLPPDAGPCVCPIEAIPANAGYFSCRSALETALTSCITDAACDSDKIGACIDAYIDAGDACPPLDKASYGQAELMCFGAVPFTCGSGEAIPDLYACDMEPDCPDMSDEATELCSFICSDGQEIPKYFVCDGDPDCMDMSDEAKELCIFTCSDGQEIPKDYVCDGEPDCMDMSDEVMCP